MNWLSKMQCDAKTNISHVSTVMSISVTNNEYALPAKHSMRMASLATFAMLVTVFPMRLALVDQSGARNELFNAERCIIIGLKMETCCIRLILIYVSLMYVSSDPSYTN